ncbi:hypothetical protein N7G274_005101 [Stereocaulon virgatum]|uniref:Uncharacterized protein n=1 Tax=Stereocaulon virgatum TaxID=373712 RepID=A0ABR4AB20_9LECA
MHFLVLILLASTASLTNAGEMQMPDFSGKDAEPNANPAPPAAGAPAWGTVTSFFGGTNCPSNTGGRVLDAKPGFCTQNTAYAAGDLVIVDFGKGTAAFDNITFYTDQECQTASTMGPVDSESQGGGCVTLGEIINSFQPTA